MPLWKNSQKKLQGGRLPHSGLTTVSQKEVNHARRKWQESCAEMGRDDPHTMALLENMRQKRRAWTRTIEKAKTSHWKQFLDEAGEGKLWKAATYMRPRDSWGCIPALKLGDREVTENQEKAQAFMDSFFPTMAPAQREPLAQPPTELPWQPLSEAEVFRSLKAAKTSTAPGEDGLPMLIWKRLWRHLGNLITRVFAASIDLGYHPQRWRSARIVVLRKPGKPDYSVPGAYRPISLLNTLGKLLEAVMARRLSYYAEHYGLLPDTQFGGRPGRTTEQALLVLANAIDRAWEITMERAEQARSNSDIVIYSDASGRQGHLGAAAVALDDSLETTEKIQIQVGPMERWSVHAAELIGILHAINIINKIALQRRRSADTRMRSTTILSDSMSAIQAIQNPGNKSGQQIIHAILQAAANTKTHGIAVRLQWMPGHCEAPGNDTADQLAKEAAIPGKTHPFSPLLSRERAHIRKGIHAQWEREWKESRNGGHLRGIDNALPAKYTRRLYGSLPRNRVYLLTQLRTGHCWLSTYAKAFHFRDDDLCFCGKRESLIHVLLDCPALRDLRRELRGKIGDAFNSMSTLLGSSGERWRGRPVNASRAKTVEAVLDFAEASQRFRSRAPRGQQDKQGLLGHDRPRRGSKFV
ncbi:hypothetical protein N7492_009832 [Penicillium capsulatum]|uniref:RNase H type-1 domain-containing protein n=1 Tax=Penicillium capsulatum TaxID=69766 RepID=A0A9W9HN67_9EURO|nr:hypothetical protein N7492_009832 [Penicillium capsulatum]